MAVNPRARGLCGSLRHRSGRGSDSAQWLLKVRISHKPHVTKWCLRTPPRRLSSSLILSWVVDETIQRSITTTTTTSEHSPQRERERYLWDLVLVVKGKLFSFLDVLTGKERDTRKAAVANFGENLREESVRSEGRGVGGRVPDSFERSDCSCGLGSA